MFAIVCAVIVFHAVFVFGGYQAIQEHMPRLGSTPREAFADTMPRVQAPKKTLDTLQIMNNPLALKHFMHFASTANHAGPLLFFQRVHEFREAPSDGVREAMYDVIWWLHLAPDAYFRIHVDPGLQLAISSHTDQLLFPSDMLDNAQTRMRRVMEHKLLPEFHSSNAYRCYLREKGSQTT